MVSLSEALRAAGVARYQDQNLGITIDLYPVAPPMPEEMQELMGRKDPSEDDERDDQFLGTGSAPPLLRKLASGEFGSHK